LSVELYRIANERRPTTTTFSANERITYLLVLLSDLAAAANRCAAAAKAQSIRGSRRGRGGKAREGTTSKSTLLYALFEAYTVLRRQYPQQAAPPRRRRLRNNRLIADIDAPPKAFVRAGLALAEPGLAEKTATTCASIDAAFDRWEKTNQSANGD
jgi:hypothetical protein